MTFVDSTKGLFSHKVYNHIGSAHEERLHISQLGMMLTEVAAHINMPCNRFISRMEAHCDSTAIVTVQLGGSGVSETQCAKEHAEI